MEKCLKGKKALVFLAAIAVAIGFLTQVITVEFTLQNNNKMDGTASLYYQYLPRTQFSEEHVSTCEFNDNDMSFRIRTMGYLGGLLRLDCDTESTLYVTKMKIKFNGITIYTATGKELAEQIIDANGTNIKLDNGILELRVEGEDPNISFCSFHSKVLLVLLELIRIIVAIFLMIGGVKLLLFFYHKNKEQFWQGVRIATFCAGVLVIVYADARLIHTLWNTGEQYYFVNENGAYETAVETTELSREFTVVGKKTTSLELRTNGENPEGKVRYIVWNDKSKMIVQSEWIEVKKLMTSDSALRLDVEKANLEQGKDYKVTVYFENCTNLNVLCNINGMAIQQNFKFIYRTEYLALIIIVSVVAVFFMALLLRFGLKNKLYVALFLTSGILAMFLIPPASRDDEYRHFLRVYTLAQGQFYLEPSEIRGDEIGNIGSTSVDYIIDVPKEVSEIRLLDHSENYNTASYYAEVNYTLCVDKVISILKSAPKSGTDRVSVIATGNRSMFFYWPQVITAWIAMQLQVRPLGIYYFARLGQVLFGTLIGWVCLKLASSQKILIWLVSFVPNIILLRSSCNSDGILISEILLVFSIMIWIRDKKIDILSVKAILPLVSWAILSYIIINTKFPYVVICLGVWLLLRRENLIKMSEFVRRYRKILVVILTVLVFAGIVWEGAIDHGTFLMQKINGFIPKEHTDYIANNFKSVIVLFGKEWIKQLMGLWRSLNGYSIVPYAWLLVITLLFAKKEYSWKRKIWFALASAVMILSIVLVGFTLIPANSGYIWGITFRYLLPALPIMAVIFPCGNEESQTVVERIFPVFGVAELAVSCMSWLIWFDRI